MALSAARLLFLAALLGVVLAVLPASQPQEVEDEPSELLEQWFILEFGSAGGRRARRDVLELLLSIPGLSALLPLLANVNVAALVSASLALAREALSYMHCCQSVPVPPEMVNSILQCMQEPAMVFVANVSSSVAGRQANAAARMLEPPVEGSQICNLVEGEMCTARCALQKLNMLAEDGLPSSAAITALLPDMLASSQLDVMRPAVQTCEQQLQAAREAKEGEMSEYEKCWAANTMLSCLQRQIFEECPETQKQSGPVCLVRLGKSFLRDLPSKAMELTHGILNGLRALLVGS